MPVHHWCPALQELTWMASVDDQEKQSSKSWLRHAVESALIALDRPAGFLVPVGAAVVCIKAVSSFLNALLVHQTENAFLGEWASESSLLHSSLLCQRNACLPWLTRLKRNRQSLCQIYVQVL